MRYYFLAFTFLVFCIDILAQDLSDYYPSTQGQVLNHTYYALDYNEQHEQANWVIYFPGYFGDATRTDNFREDPDVTTGSATLADYKASGYDRGHLAPAADFSLNELSMSESFYFSNMSPQVPSFNRGIWKSLEDLVRTWSMLANSPYDIIVTGPVLTKSCGSIGNHVTVPCAYYKIYVNIAEEKAIAFVLPNEASKKSLSEFVVSIDDVEKMTGIDFFPALEDGFENELERMNQPQIWNWNPDKPELSTGDQIRETEPKEIQCKGVTASGKQCSRKAGSSGFCWQHEQH